MNQGQPGLHSETLLHRKYRWTDRRRTEVGEEEENGEKMKGRREGRKGKRWGEGRDQTQLPFWIGHAPQLGESWYTEKTCTTLCTCSVHSNVTCNQTACEANHVCLRQNGLLRCAAGKQGMLQGTPQSLGVAFQVLHPPPYIPCCAESDVT